ncbi:dipeptide/oligopeptide/nickel ABC transporter permease/ATP-binding protein [Kineosporia sp. R_H_3]|uniref:dipeptide/oligopeptide/nickel ABC transporter permease/ATP-binding protein n=1 Tax=Kineosporia sp. R_H_3 TaxID=1961848 RepID=UPI000B4AEB0A|nr:dipeptide/oligopeptide/nickel ABC transporter permease/ATP-binding protein [Kineosporia sp. R_H_3]
MAVDTALLAEAALRGPSARKAWRRSPSLLAGGTVLLTLVVVGVLAPVLLSGPAGTLTGDANLRPGGAHWLGTDPFGRDALARALVATRLTLLMAAGATALSFVAGVAVGAGALLAPPRVRQVLLRVVDAAVAFPSLVLALVIAAVLGAGAGSAVVAIGLAGVPGFARLTYNLTQGVATRDFVTTAHLLGVPGPRVLARHVLPNVSGPLLVLLTSSFALSLLEISGLSFVGLGVQSPQYDWGRLLNEALPSIYTSPWLVLAPSLMLVLAGAGAMLAGDGLARLVDPRQAHGAPAGTRSTRRAAAAVTDVADGADGAGAGSDDAVLVVDGLVVEAAGRRLVDDVSFRVRPGEVVGLVGESGSGKSTIAMAVAGLLADGLVADARELRLRDMDLLGRPPARRLATEIGIVFQDPSATFNPALRLGSQLTEVLRVHLRRSRTASRDAVVAALTEIKVTEPRRRLRQHPHELSGGMLQRASIAAALSTEPALLVADEPTTALDVTVQAEVLRQLRRLQREHGTAVLFISHDIGVVGALCDTVLVLRDGRVVDRTTGAALRAGAADHPWTAALLAARPGARHEEATP